MPRNLHTSALLRACRQVPNWYKWGGRQSPYAIEWIQQGSGTEYYTIFNPNTWGGQLPPRYSITLWFKVTGTLIATRYGLLGVYHVPVDILSLVVNGTSNELEVIGASGIMASGPIQSGWNNATVVEEPTGLILYINGQAMNSPVAGVGGQPIDALTLGATNYIGSVPPTVFLDGCVVDEIAFFSDAVDPVVIYNNGIPLLYEDDYPTLEVSYEVEKSTGAIHNRTIYPTFKNTTGGLTYKPFDWTGTGTNTITQVVTTGLRSTDTNQFVQMADNYGDYGRGVQSLTRDNRTPLGSGNSIESLANGLMPYPAGGGFETTGYANAFVGSVDEPNLSPQVSKTITMSTGDSTDYDSIGGPNTLSGVTDARSGKLFPPTFVKK